jgi:hypothetical protein
MAFHNHQYHPHHRPPTPHPIATTNLQIPNTPMNIPNTPTSNMSSSSSSSDFENFLQLQKPTISYHHNQPVPSSSPMALNTTTPPAVQMSHIPQMIDQTNYIQRGDISGHWATYFSGPNYLKVHSFMGQPVVGPTVPPPPVHQATPAPQCYRTPAHAYPPVAYPQRGR